MFRLIGNTPVYFAADHPGGGEAMDPVLLDRSITLLSFATSAMINSSSEQSLLDEICRMAVEDCGYRLAWVGIAEHDENRSVRPVAQHGFNEGYLESIRISWKDDEIGRGPTGTAIRTAAIQVNQDFLQNPRMAPWRENAIEHGFQSSIALPLQIDGEAVGALAIYASESYAFSSGEIKILELLANSLAYGMHTRRINEKFKEVAQQLQRLNEELENRIELRTHELKVARDEAERANAAKSEFLSRMSHELRTPLNAILGFGQLLEADRDHPLSEMQGDNVREIMHGGRHLLELVNEVLDLARIESGRLEIVIEPVAIKPLVEDCIAQVRPLVLQREIHITAKLNAADVVMADYTRLKQVLINLLSNAVKYNRKGGSIRVHSTIAHAERLCVCVQDTGHGIPQESLHRLFKPFERLESSYSGIEGTGIGLALVKKLVEAMDGTVGVESKVNVGSTFWFELPLGTAAESDKPALDLSHLPVRPSGQLRKVLYVEDNHANLKLVEKIFSMRKDIELLAALTGEIGLEIARSELPDLILLDINLPDINGFEVLSKLKNDPLTGNIPVVAVSANALHGDMQRGIAAGFMDYLVKPLDLSRLMNVVEVALLYKE